MALTGSAWIQCLDALDLNMVSDSGGLNSIGSDPNIPGSLDCSVTTTDLLSTVASPWIASTGQDQTTGPSSVLDPRALSQAYGAQGKCMTGRAT